VHEVHVGRAWAQPWPGGKIFGRMAHPDTI